MIAPIVKEPNLILHQKALPVAEITRDIQTLIDTLIETMHVAQGVGLAANQINSNLNILVASPDGKKGKELVLINAKILETEGKVRLPEGCLSLPGISSEVRRAAAVTVQGLSRKGQPQVLKAEGLLARILQHEVDHLQGRLFPDRLRLLERKKLLHRYQSLINNLRQVDL